jgi:hypothetical protein
MFAYNPTVNDNSGQITAAGTLAMAKGITDGVNSATGAISGGMTQSANKGQMTREELDMMSGGMDFLAQQGAIDGGMLEKFQSGSIGTKRGIYNMGQLQYANMLKQQNIQMNQQGQAGGGGSVDYGAPLDIQ